MHIETIMLREMSWTEKSKIYPSAYIQMYCVIMGWKGVGGWDQ